MVSNRRQRASCNFTHTWRSQLESLLCRGVTVLTLPSEFIIIHWMWNNRYIKAEMLSFLLFFILILYDQKPHVAAIFCGASSRLFLLSQTLPGGTQFFCSAMNVCLLLSCVRLFVNPWTVAHQAPLSMGFCRQEYWSGLPCLPPVVLLCYTK